MATTTQAAGPLVPGDAFARTYSNRVYDDPWNAVQDYFAVADFAADHPAAGAAAIANRFDLPRGRVRPWLEGARPDCVRGLQAAASHGWIDIDPTTDVFRGLNALVAWVFSGGSISTDTWMPYFVATDHHDVPALTKAAVLAGVELDFTRDASATRARELRPIQHGSVLGRVLVVLGAPRGDKAAGADVNLPDYLTDVSERLAREFVQVYVHNRGQTDDEGIVLRFREDRSKAYLEAITRLVRRLTGEWVVVSEPNVVLSDAAARELAVWDPLLDVE